MPAFNFLFQDGLLSVRNNVDYVFPDPEDMDEEVARSYLGTPVLSNLVFAAGSYQLKGETINFEGLRIDTILMTVNQVKNIVKTPVAGRNGSVKEYISDGDFVIGLQGAIVNETGGSAYPRESMQILMDLLRAPVALQFTSNFLDFLGTFDLVVTDYNIPQIKGQRNMQVFQVNCLSDNPLELQLNAESQL